MTVSVQVRMADYGALSRALKSSAPAIGKAMRKRIGAEAKPIMAEARRNMRGMGGVPSEFRAGAASRVRLSLRDSRKRTEVRILSRAPGGQWPDMTRKLNTQGYWRHPVYADPRKGRADWTWVEQHGEFSWFDRPFESARHRLVWACEKAMQDAFDEMNRKT